MSDVSKQIIKIINNVATKPVLNVFNNTRSSLVSFFNQLKAIAYKIEQHNCDEQAHTAILEDIEDISKAITEIKFLNTGDETNATIISKIGYTPANSSTSPKISYGSGAPSFIPAKIGDIYIDTTNYKTYISKAANSSADWIKQNGSYALSNSGFSASFPPAASTAYYFGQTGTAITTSSTARRMYIPKKGSITACKGWFNHTAGSGENSSFYIRVNGTTDYLVSNTLNHSATVVLISNASLNIPVNVGDFIEFKWVTPAWTTLPTAVIIGATINIDL